jgi:hypothetical protein
MDKEKEGLSMSAQDMIANAAQANVDGAINVASSAVTALVDTVVGRTKKARSGKKGACETKAASASKRGKTKRSARKKSVLLGTPFAMSKLRIEVLGDEILVILPATSYGVTYCKSGNSPHLVTKNFVPKIDTGAPITQAEFLAEAWQAATAKAQELGWIV